MTNLDLFEILGNISDSYVLSAQTYAIPRRLSSRRVLLIAAVVGLALLLVGCTVAAYTQGWFPGIFAAHSESPLSDSQIEFIENNEQIIGEYAEGADWSVQLKSTITDGDTGMILFGITAPEDVDLEGIYELGKAEDTWQRIVPGNESMDLDRQRRRTLVLPSCGNVDNEKNFIWQNGGRWEADNDGKANTMDYLVILRCERLYPDKEMLLEDPFGSGITFNIRFLDFVYEYQDPAVWKSIDEKYAGMTDYMVAEEDMAGLYRSEVLAEGTWEFDVSLSIQSNSMELITGEPVMTWGLVTWKLDDEPAFYETGSGIAAVRITSFVLNSFGAAVTYELKEPAISAFIEYQQHNGYTDRFVYAVMKDGSQIPLHTHGTGDQLRAESPIVLSEVEYILLGDGTELRVP